MNADYFTKGLGRQKFEANRLRAQGWWQSIFSHHQNFKLHILHILHILSERNHGKINHAKRRVRVNGMYFVLRAYAPQHAWLFYYTFRWSPIHDLMSLSTHCHVPPGSAMCSWILRLHSCLIHTRCQCHSSVYLLTSNWTMTVPVRVL